MEQVMVVESDALAPWIEGPFSEIWRNAVYVHALQHHRFLDRPVAEQDPTWRQVIPYVLVRHAHRWLLLRRTSKQTETRLHHRLSLGVGGHINPTDPTGEDDIIQSGMKRELEEEIRLHGQYSVRYIGVLCDDADDVSRVHLGLVFVIDVDAPDFEVLEAHTGTDLAPTKAENPVQLEPLS